ncbi:hypothetical protein Tco_0734877 [Tanacetum coccineum]
MPTEMELTLEQTQQGVSYEVSVNPHGFEGYSNQTRANDKAIFAPCSIANCFNAGNLKMEVYLIPAVSQDS